MLIKNGGLHEVSPSISPQNNEVIGFSVSPSGEQLAVIERADDRQILRIARWRNEQLDAGSESQSFTVTGASGLCWLSENELVFDQIDTTKPDVSFRDLYTLKLEREAVQQLTQGARAFEPTCRPEQSLVYFNRAYHQVGQTETA
jgi:hypothetical protein